MNRIELGKTPIPGDNPSGADVSFEPEFEALEGELQKMSSPSASGGVDWKKIAHLAETILETKSKNLLVASYMNFALLKTEGLRGLSDGIHVLREMLETHWETLYPPKKRMRGRVNAVTWWADKVEAAIADLTAEIWPREDRRRLAEDLDAMDAFLGENMENAPILRSLEEHILSLVEEEPEPEPVPEQSAASPEAPAAAGPVPGEAPKPESRPAAPPRTPAPASAPPVPLPAADLSNADAEHFLEHGLDVIRQAAGLYSVQDRFAVLPYRLLRIGSWLSVQELPPSGGGRTMLPPPDGQIASMLETMRRANNWSDLLDAAESRVPQFLFWLDLNRYAAESLEALGHPETAEAVAEETVGYVKRLTGMEKLTFSDGRPFAGEATREWLKGRISRLSPGVTAPGDGSGGIESQAAQTLIEAQKLSGENKRDQALDLFREKMGRSASLRERFIWQTGLCRFLLSANLPRLMLPFVREMLATLDDCRVERWEPPLAIEGLALALTGLRLQEGGRDEELIERTLNRIAALHPSRALEFMD